MNQEQIVRRLLEHGILVSPKELEGLTKDNLDDFIRKRTGARAEARADAGSGPSFAVKKPDSKRYLTPQDFAEQNSRKYEALHDMLIKRMQGVMSINNITSSFSDVSVIGMVVDKTSAGFRLEDRTGSIDVVSSEPATVGDVIGIIGRVREKRLFERQMLYPDVPLLRSFSRPKARLLLAVGSLPPGADYDMAVIKSEEERQEGKEVYVDQLPSSVEISAGKQRLTVLVCGEDDQLRAENAADFIRRRYLPSHHNIGDVFIMREIPDILWILSERQLEQSKMSRIYKGIIIVSGHSMIVDTTAGGIEMVSDLKSENKE